jgi:hypothetical protein
LAFILHYFRMTPLRRRRTDLRITPMAATTDRKPIRAGIFPTVDEADTAVRNLVHAGIPKEYISVVCSDESRERHFGTLAHSREGVSNTDKSILLESGLIGGMLGGLVSLVGIATTGGLGILAVGPIVAGGVAGTLYGLFVGRGVEDELARFYDQAVTKGNILVAVEDEGEGEESAQRLAEAARILRESGAEPFALDEG